MADDVALPNASVVYAAAQREILRPVKECLAAAVGAGQRKVSCTVPQLENDDIDALAAWVDKSDWTLTYGSDSYKEDGSRGDYPQDYYYVSLKKKDDCKQ